MEPKRLLLVDGETGNLTALKKILQGPLVCVDIASTRDDAYILLNNPDHTYDVVITDIRLTTVAREEGLELLKYVKKYQPGTLVIVITEHGKADMIRRAVSLGADLYFEKPVAPTIFKIALECWGVG